MTPTRTSLRLTVVVLALVVGVVGPARAQVEYFVTADDGIGLATDVYLPLGHGWGPWPVILQRTPYGKRSAMTREACLAFSASGFACVVQDVRGRGRSDGSNSVFRDDGPDGRATLEWIRRMPFCDGHIGAFGGSALGITEYAMAPGAVPELEAMIPAVATPDLYHHGVYQGGALRWGLLYEWLEGQDALPFLEEVKAHRLADWWWDEVAVLPHAEEVRVPAFHLGGWYDIFLQGTLDAFEKLERDGGTGARGRQHLRIGPWTHTGLGSSVAGELVYPANAATVAELVVDFRDYFQHWLQGEKPTVADWPKARIYLMGASGETGAPGNVWLDLEGWPPATVTTRFYLGADGTLRREAAARAESRTLPMDPRDPVPTRGGANLFATVAGVPQGIGPMDQRPIEGRADVAVFTTGVLASPLTVAGRITVRIFLRPDTKDLDVAVRLTDVYPDGRSMLVTDGIRRARMRCSDTEECLLDPGVPVELRVDLWSTAMVFNAGHRIRIDVSGTNFPRFEVNPNTGGDLNSATGGVVARPDLLMGAAFSSCLELPLLAPEHTPRRHLLRGATQP